MSPGAAHISSTASPGWGFRTWEATIEGRFWRNMASVNSAFREGAS